MAQIGSKELLGEIRTVLKGAKDERRITDMSSWDEGTTAGYRLACKALLCSPEEASRHYVLLLLSFMTHQEFSHVLLTVGRGARAPVKFKSDYETGNLARATSRQSDKQLHAA